MMRKAYLGMNALFILIFHGGVMVVEALGYVPYSRTLFFPMVLIFPLLMGIVGFWEKDKVKAPAILAALIALGMLVYWAVMLASRLSAA